MFATKMIKEAKKKVPETDEQVNVSGGREKV